jgi:hypothetical protein
MANTLQTLTGFSITVPNSHWVDVSITRTRLTRAVRSQGITEKAISTTIIGFQEIVSSVGKKLPFLLIFKKFMKNGAFFVFTASSESL